MRRRWMLTGVWALSTLAATLVAWAAVRLVADQVSPAEVLPLPTTVALADVTDSPLPSTASDARSPRTRGPRPAGAATDGTTEADATVPRDTAGEAPAAPPPGDDPPQDDPPRAPEPQPVTKAYELVGGVVTVRYTGASANLVEASPDSGFVVEVNDGGPDKVDVRFRSDEHESRFVTRVRNGHPDPQREERPR